VCRHLAYLGPPASLRSLLIDPPHSLYRQAWAPRRQRHGTVNADGFGIGWYAGADPVPARYRRGEPIWGDPSLPGIARVIRSGAVLAAVRSATPGTAAGPEAAAPFGSGPWLFSHNGAAQGWRDWGEAAYRSWADPGRPPLGGGVTARPGTPSRSAPSADAAPAGGPPSLLSCLEALTDAALLWALTLQRLRSGLPLDAALAGTIAAVEAAGGTGRLNLLLTDGRSVAATAYGDTLWYRQAPPDASGREDAAQAGPRENGPERDGIASVTVASEPDDDGPGWTEVPDRHVLIATSSQVCVRPLSDLSDHASPHDHAWPRDCRSPADHVSPDGRGSPADHASPHDCDSPASHDSPAGNDVRTEGIATS
jgi:glutamine amidotransferase